jgi:hypothetical protein
MRRLRGRMNPGVPDQRCQEVLGYLLLGLPGVREGRMFGVPALRQKFVRGDREG